MFNPAALLGDKIGENTGCESLSSIPDIGLCASQFSAVKIFFMLSTVKYAKLKNTYFSQVTVLLLHNEWEIRKGYKLCL